MPTRRRRPSRRDTSAKKPSPKKGLADQKDASLKGASAGKAVRKKKRAGGFRLLSGKRSLLLGLLLIVALTFFVRCLHLFDSGHYYIISADSHLFHWMADRVMEGQSIPTHVQPSGLAYPLAYIASAVGSVFNMSDQDALTFTCKYLPALMGVLTALVIYLGLSRMYDRRMGLCCALAWAVLPHAYFIQAAGYLDRDAINVPLILIGALAFFFSKRWHLKIRGRDLGWVLGAILVLGIELTLFLEWSWVGPGLLLTIITAYFMVDLLVKALVYEEDRLSVEDQSIQQRVVIRVKGAIRETGWKPFALIVSLNILVALVSWDTTAETLRQIGDLLRPGGGQIAELQGLTWLDLRLFEFFILLIPIGLFLSVMRHREADLLFLSWIVVLVILSFFSRRLILYAAPPAAVIGGMVVANLWDFQYARKRERTIQKIVGVLVLVIMIGLSARAYDLAAGPKVAADTNWCESLTYLSEESPEDARVMTWWDYGYWVLDIGERRPVVDGGLYGHTRQQDSDVGLAYCTDKASEAVEVMKKYGAKYLIFSRLEQNILPVIASYGLGAEWPEWWQKWENGVDNSLYRRSLYEQFQSEGELERVCPAPGIRYPEVVILGLKGG